MIPIIKRTKLYDDKEKKREVEMKFFLKILYLKIMQFISHKLKIYFLNCSI